MSDNVIKISTMMPAYPRPWRIEGFIETYAESDHESHGFMIMAADGVSIVAQCLTLRNAELICDSVNRAGSEGQGG